MPRYMYAKGEYTSQANVKVSKEDLDKIDKLAEWLNCDSRSQVIRRLIRDEYEKRIRKTERRKNDENR